MRTLRYIVLVIIAILLLAFSFANRHFVAVSFDPFAPLPESAFAISVPLFVVAIVCAMLGVVFGASVTWFAQGRYRRASRINRKAAAQWKSQAEALKAVHPDPRALPKA